MKRGDRDFRLLFGLLRTDVDWGSDFRYAPTARVHYKLGQYMSHVRKPQEEHTKRGEPASDGSSWTLTARELLEQAQHERAVVSLLK